MEVSLKDLSKIKSDELIKRLRKKTFRMIVMGNTLSGKSYFTMKILLPKIIDKFTQIILFTRKYNKEEYEHSLEEAGFDIDNLTIFTFDKATSKNEEIMEKIQEVKDKQETKNLIRKEKDGKHIYEPVLLIFDDIIDRYLLEKPAFLEIFFNFRHYNMSVIMCSQVTNKDISPQMKSNIEYNVFFRLNEDLQRAYPYGKLYNAIKMQNNKLSKLSERMLKDFVEQLYMQWVFDTDKKGDSKYQYLMTDENGNIFGKI